MWFLHQVWMWSTYRCDLQNLVQPEVACDDDEDAQKLHLSSGERGTAVRMVRLLHVVHGAEDKSVEEPQTHAHQAGNVPKVAKELPAEDEYLGNARTREMSVNGWVSCCFCFEGKKNNMCVWFSSRIDLHYHLLIRHWCSVLPWTYVFMVASSQ